MLKRKNQEEKCQSCPNRLYCQNVDYMTISKDGINCFKAPRCSECPVGTHCKNRGLSGVTFHLKKCSATPDCFSGFHSYKWFLQSMLKELDFQLLFLYSSIFLIFAYNIILPNLRRDNHGRKLKNGRRFENSLPSNGDKNVPETWWMWRYSPALYSSGSLQWKVTPKKDSLTESPFYILILITVKTLNYSLKFL